MKTLEEKAQDASDRFDKVFQTNPINKFYLGFIAGYKLARIEDEPELTLLKKVRECLKDASPHEKAKR